SDPAAAAEHLSEVQQQAAGALDEMRNLVVALRPKSLERDGLAATLHDHVEGLRRIHQAAIEARIDEAEPLPPDQQLGILRIAQEALHNAVKHAGPVPIRLDRRQSGCSSWTIMPWCGEDCGRSSICSPMSRWSVKRSMARVRRS